MSWLPSVGAALALVAQLGLALTPIGEARVERSSAPHVELAGTSSHYAHNDATCATCQARSLTGLTTRADGGMLSRRTPILPLVATENRVASQVAFPLGNPRAPPISPA